MTALNGSLGTSFALDGNGLDELKRKARDVSNGDSQKQALRQAAGQFEAVFMNMLLKSMRDSLPKDGVFESESTRTFTGMYDQQLAQKISEKGVGLADMIVRQVEARGGAMPAVKAPTTPSTLDKIKSATAEASSTGDGNISGAPKEFVQRMWKSARAAEGSTGMPAQFILGQAALDSGWGKREIRHADGATSHNLFGIKAGPGWKGATVDAATIEYVGGVARKVTEKFRAYDSYADSFADYARLMTNNPRYAGTLKSGNDADRFARSLQDAGYATDPLYAHKLSRVIGQTLRAVG